MAPLSDLVRPQEGRMLAGVCAGISRRYGIDVQLVRAVMAMAAILGTGGVWIYGLLWLVMPEEGSTTAGIDTLLARARGGQAAQREDAPREPQEVFNPYSDDPR